MFGIVLRQTAIALLGLGLGGCLGLGPDPASPGTSSLAASPAVARRPVTGPVVAEVGFDDPEDDESALREFAPWRSSRPQVAARPDAAATGTPEIRVASARRGIVDAAAAPDTFPEDPEELKLWLGRRSERAAEAHREHVARLQRMELQSAAAVRDICRGC